MLETERVDLIVLDLHFPPEIDTPRVGLTAFTKLCDEWPQVPVVIATSNDDEVVKAALLARGARAFLEKPLDPERLDETLRSILEGERRQS